MDDIGIIYGTGIGGIGATENAVRVYDERGSSRISPLAITQLMPNSSTGQVAIKFGIRGPSLTITTACAASANAIGEAKRMIEQKETQLELTDDTTEQNKIKKDIEQLKLKMTKVKAATGGLLKMSIGGEAGTSERYDRRRDYQAYAEGDMVEDESLMSPPEMNPMAETDMEMEAEDNMDMEDMGDMDGVVDTSALSEEEEKVVDDAVEMFPELEGIIPKIVATEFTEDGEVEGPGTGTSDSIPALLSDGEFVFTAKAVKHLGVDKLRKMMKDAEAAYDSGMQNQEADAAMTE